MRDKKRTFYRAVGMMVGGIVGVGIFGLPYAFAQSGLFIGFIEFGVIASLLLVVHFMNAELSLRSRGEHRFVGVVELYLGRRWKWLAMLVMCGSAWGAMVAYMIVGGNFLFTLLSPVFGGVEMSYAYLAGILAGLLMYRGLLFASKLEVFIIGGLVVLFLWLIGLAVPHIDSAHLVTVSPQQWFAPYGVILFSLSSIGIVYEMRDVLGRSAHRLLGKAVLWGFGIVAALYALFVFVTVGVAGSSTEPVAFDSLISLVHPHLQSVVSLLAALTILSIYFMMGIQLQDVFRFDLRFSRLFAWLAAAVVPIGIYSFGAQSFIPFIGFIGALFGGTAGIMIVLSYRQLLRDPICRERTCLSVPASITYAAIGIFLAGIIVTIHQLLI